MSSHSATDLIADVSALLSRKPQVLPDDTLKAFVQSHFSRREHYLKVLQNHPAPLYVLERSVLEARAGRMKTAFDRVLPQSGFYYAVKSNNHPEVARTMLAARFGLDVSSGLELQTVLNFGARDIVFSGPGKTPQELRLAAAHADRVVVLLDSFGELHRLETIGAELNCTVRCGVRLTVNLHGLWRKFGIPLDDLAGFWQAAGRCPHVDLQASKP